MPTIFYWFFVSTAPTATLTSVTNAGVERNIAQFVCKVTGTPTPNITWYKDSKRLGDSRRYYYVKFPIANGNGELLRFLYLRPTKHQGNYSCRATNTIGSSTSKQVFLQVYRRRGGKSSGSIFLIQIVMKLTMENSRLLVTFTRSSFCVLYIVHPSKKSMSLFLQVQNFFCF